MASPLEGIRILDWTIWQQGPVATAMLGDLGAEVIKIEERVAGDPGRGMKRVRGLAAELPGGRNFYFENNNRNKRGIALDLRKPGGKEIIYRLAEKSDVFVQNFRPGVAGRLGLDYVKLKECNPRIIYATASGYGLKGPERDEPTFDYLGLARSGIMNAVGDPDTPPQGMVGGLADQMGGIFLAYGILAALVARERLGVGQEIDCSHFGSMIAFQALNVAAACLVGRDLPRQERASAFNPLWNHYQCQDGKWIALAHLQPDRHWPPLCKALGIGHLEKDPRFADAVSRERNARELVVILDRIFATRQSAEWVKYLKSQGDFIVTPVNSVADLLSDPQAVANEYVTDYEHPTLGKVKLPGIPVHFSKTPGAIRLPAPIFSQHTEEVLMELANYSWEDIEKLKQEEVI